MAERFDAVVIGGGPAGSTSALLLARAGWSVALLERKPFPRRKVCGEYLSATNLPLFDALGLGAIFRDLAGPPVTRVGVFARSRRRLEAPLGGRALPRRLWGRAAGPRASRCVAARRGATRPGRHRRAAHGRRRLASRRSGAAAILQRAAARASRPGSAIAAHGSWEPGPLPTQLPRPGPRTGRRSPRFQGPLRERGPAGGPDAAARVSGRLRRHGARRPRHRQPVMLHSPRCARGGAALLFGTGGGRGAGAHRRSHATGSLGARRRQATRRLVGRGTDPARRAAADAERILRRRQRGGRKRIQVYRRGNLDGDAVGMAAHASPLAENAPGGRE